MSWTDIIQSQAGQLPSYCVDGDIDFSSFIRTAGRLAPVDAAFAGQTTSLLNGTELISIDLPTSLDASPIHVGGHFLNLVRVNWGLDLDHPPTGLRSDKNLKASLVCPTPDPPRRYTAHLAARQATPPQRDGKMEKRSQKLLDKEQELIYDLEDAVEEAKETRKHDSVKLAKEREDAADAKRIDAIQKGIDAAKAAKRIEEQKSAKRIQHKDENEKAETAKDAKKVAAIIEDRKKAAIREDKKNAVQHGKANDSRGSLSLLQLAARTLVGCLAVACVFALA